MLGATSIGASCDFAGDAAVLDNCAIMEDIPDVPEEEDTGPALRHLVTRAARAQRVSDFGRMELEAGLVDIFESESIGQLRADLRWVREVRAKKARDEENRAKDWRGRKQAIWVAAAAGITSAVLTIIITKAQWVWSVLTGHGGITP
jgi:hypothetical protein